MQNNRNLKTAVSAVMTVTLLSGVCTAFSLLIARFSFEEVKQRSLSSAQGGFILSFITAAFFLKYAPSMLNRYNQNKSIAVIAGVFLSHGWLMGEFNPFHNIYLSQEEYQKEFVKKAEINVYLLLGSIITLYVLSSIYRDYLEGSLNSLSSFFSSRTDIVRVGDANVAGETTAIRVEEVVAEPADADNLNDHDVHARRM